MNKKWEDLTPEQQQAILSLTKQYMYKDGWNMLKYLGTLLLANAIIVFVAHTVANDSMIFSLVSSLVTALMLTSSLSQTAIKNKEELTNLIKEVLR